MNDRTMLELAAKAAGIGLVCIWVNADLMYASTDQGWWNPLIDDGDALRLAVNLNLDPMFDLQMQDGTQCVAVTFPIAGDYDSVSEPTSTDPYAATRRAIVRAAAEIGKAMP
jgi:hypothetical protein